MFAKAISKIFQSLIMNLLNRPLAYSPHPSPNSKRLAATLIFRKAVSARLSSGRISNSSASNTLGRCPREPFAPHRERPPISACANFVFFTHGTYISAFFLYISLVFSNQSSSNDTQRHPYRQGAEMLRMQSVRHLRPPSVSSSIPLFALH